MNLKRRHLTSSQRAVVALDVLPMLEVEAKERQRWTPTNVEIIPPLEDEQGKARDKAAEIAQTNPRYVQDAKKLQEAAPDLLEQVRDGEKTIPQAKRELTRRQKADPPPFPDDKYRVWYVDPLRQSRRDRRDRSLWTRRASLSQYEHY
jgi:hypothetical protein